MRGGRTKVYCRSYLIIYIYLFILYLSSSFSYLFFFSFMLNRLVNQGMERWISFLDSVMILTVGCRNNACDITELVCGVYCLIHRLSSMYSNDWLRTVHESSQIYVILRLLLQIKYDYSICIRCTAINLKRLDQAIKTKRSRFWSKGC